jgi:hypothetical protein
MCFSSEGISRGSTHIRTATCSHTRRIAHPKHILNPRIQLQLDLFRFQAIRWVSCHFHQNSIIPKQCPRRSSLSRTRRCTRWQGCRKRTLFVMTVCSGETIRMLRNQPGSIRLPLVNPTPEMSQVCFHVRDDGLEGWYSACPRKRLGITLITRRSP